MSISTFDIFKIGIGPSSSHTMGPMRAARDFALRLEAAGLLARALQHETDHLNGVLFIDRMNAATKVSLAGKLKRLQKETRG